ncbi:M23 family metallopeptidase [Parasphingopyxis algicola]|uniref:M23 family metallopeptidase n=1 Tax=Parasphingopyxis algicola TaxID=2026624 RepID=UPI0015A3F581|nr:M23 family metallopeptidase [Parasphingopyxis algicola]QLC26206.1 M23 family metallopeptidase [Parasphingopyxis algicola]
MVSIAALGAVAWLAVTLVMVGLQVKGASDRIALDQREQEVTQTEARVAAYRGTVEEQVARVERRQAVLDALVRRHFGNLEDNEDEAETADGAEAAEESSAAIPEAAALQALEQHQVAFARALRAAVEQRTLQTAEAIREFGLDPRVMSRRAQGGPLIPIRTAMTLDGAIDEEIADLEIALNRLAVMELSLRAIPSAKPTAYGAMSSPFGLRRDPFTRGRAMHNGIDFRGRHGQGILATGPGRVRFAGWKGGYGRTIEIDHGAGVVTRYAHLSGINVSVGDRVDRGDRIGRMGSSGRSTATHLHYEVRINGRAVNPRPLLEADRDVLEIQSVAGRRNGDAVERG